MTTTTTERARPTPPRPAGTSALRLSLTAALAVSYVLAWWTLGGEASPPATPAAPQAPTALATWYEDLPPDTRPVVQLPQGWQLATRTAVEAAPRPVRVTASRRGRVRTRSS